METINGFFPIYASARFEMNKPADWDSLTATEKKARFIFDAEPSGFICHQCSQAIETDLEMDEAYLEKLDDNSFLESIK